MVAGVRVTSRPRALSQRMRSRVRRVGSVAGVEVRAPSATPTPASHCGRTRTSCRRALLGLGGRSIRPSRGFGAVRGGTRSMMSLRIIDVVIIELGGV
jgi:hypothetical protein